MKHPVLWAGLTLGALMLGSTVVTAAPVTLQVCTTASCWNGSYTIANGVPVDWTDVQTMQNVNGKSVNDWETANGLDVEGWSLSLDSDPFVTNNFTITNTSGSTQTFSLTASLGVSPAIPNGQMRGSIGFNLTDNNNSSAILETSGGSIYTATIDGNTARTLWDATTTFSTASSTGGGTDFGFPVWEIAPESIDSTIGIKIMFSLTAGDSVAFTSNFTVEPVVPVPAAVWLFGSGLLGLLFVARRKTA